MYVRFIYILIGISMSYLFSGCTAKGPNTQIILEKRYIDTSREEPLNVFGNKEDSKFYDNAKVTKVWIDSYITETNIRVREQFIDIFVKAARFINTEFAPEESDR